jgi:hypothetical protein
MRLPNDSGEAALKPIPEIDIDARRRIGLFLSFEILHQIFRRFLASRRRAK